MADLIPVAPVQYLCGLDILGHHNKPATTHSGLWLSTERNTRTLDTHTQPLPAPPKQHHKQTNRPQSTRHVHRNHPTTSQRQAQRQWAQTRHHQTKQSMRGKGTRRATAFVMVIVHCLTRPAQAHAGPEACTHTHTLMCKQASKQGLQASIAAAATAAADKPTSSSTCRSDALSFWGSTCFLAPLTESLTHNVSTVSQAPPLLAAPLPTAAAAAAANDQPNMPINTPCTCIARGGPCLTCMHIHNRLRQQYMTVCSVQLLSLQHHVCAHVKAGHVLITCCCCICILVSTCHRPGLVL